MQQNDLDTILAAEDYILPSSGFTASVMEAVQCEAITPAPIPFPWKAALPGIAAAFIALVFVFSAFVHFVHIAGRAGHSATLPVSVQAALLAAIHLGLGWVALSLLLSLIAMAGSMRLAGSRI